MAVKLTAYTLIIENEDGARIEISPGREISIRLADPHTHSATGSRLVSFDELWDTCLTLVGPRSSEPDWEHLKPPPRELPVSRRKKNTTS